MRFAMAWCCLLLTALRSPSFADAPNNLLSNGRFETAVENKPAGWSFFSPNPELFRTQILTPAGESPALQLQATESRASGYWFQTIKIKPGTSYRLTARAKVYSGTMLIYATGSNGPAKVDERVFATPTNQNPLVPLFWKPEWAAGSKGSAPGIRPQRLGLPAGEWSKIELTFDSGALTQITINLGSYFSRGKYAFSDVVLQEVPRP